MIRKKWDKDFPDVIVDRDVGEASKHPSYAPAKSGSASDAYDLAIDLVTDAAIQKIKSLRQSKSDGYQIMKGLAATRKKS